MSELGQLVEQHRKFLKSSDHLTDLMVKRARFNDFNEVDRLSRNRGRLLSILEGFKAKIEKKISTLGIEHLKTTESYTELINWAQELEKWSRRTLEKDAEITDLLTKLKSNTSQEISAVFKSKQQLKGYNLNSTKR